MKNLFKELLKFSVIVLFTIISCLLIKITLNDRNDIVNLYNKQTVKIVRYVEPEPYPSYEYLKSVTVIVEGTSRKRSWLGTGVIVKQDKNITYILTNKHIAGGAEEAIIYIEDDYGVKFADIVKKHKILDLALLKVDGFLVGKSVIKGISVSVKPQDKVYLVGHHLGRKYVYGEGVFAGYDGMRDIIQIPTLFGNSGSGVFDKNGKLVSLIFGGYIIDSAHGLGINAKNIKDFLESVGVYADLRL